MCDHRLVRLHGSHHFIDVILKAGMYRVTCEPRYRVTTFSDSFTLFIRHIFFKLTLKWVLYFVTDVVNSLDIVTQLGYTI